MHVGGMDGWHRMVSHPDWEAGKAFSAEGGWMESGDRILTMAEVAADLRSGKAGKPGAAATWEKRRTTEST